MARKSGPKTGDGPGPTPLKGTPTPPAGLDADAKKHHRETAKLLDAAGFLSKLDGDLLHLYCEAWSTWREAIRQTAATNGKVITAPNGYRQQNPWHLIAVQAAKDMKTYLDMLGMSPQARIRLKPPEADDPASSKWAEFD